MNLASDQPCKVWKTTDRDHDQEGAVILVSADGILDFKKLLGEDNEFRVSISTKKTTTSNLKVS